MLCAAALSVMLAGCSRSGPSELLETAKLEELQTNLPHAKELYREIVERYPESTEAKTARERLAAIDGAAGPK
jgi:TolA-binding protein